MRKHNNKKLLKVYFLAMLIIWTAAVFTSLGLMIRSAENHIYIIAAAQARMALAKDKMYRVWASSLGGVYSFNTKVAPNPHLSHIPDRDLKTTDGRTLTLINPAYMTRLVFEHSEKSSFVKTHLVSDKLLNPINEAKGWEVNALNKILAGNKEYSELQEYNGRTYFRFMVPFVTEGSCLKCHAIQGYKVGDIRGGISIVTDIEDIKRGEQSVENSAVAGHISLWLIVILLMRMGYVSIRKMLIALEDGEKNMRALNSRNESILSSAAESIFGVDTRGRITFINPALTKHTGYSSLDLSGKHHGQLTHERNEYGMPIENENCSIMLTIKDKTIRSTIETFIRKDGSSFFGEMFIAPIIEQNEQTGAVISFFDITERLARETQIKKALEEKSILLSELHHRVKNNLQIITGILSLQADNLGEDESAAADVLKNAQARVMSIALIHESLYKSKDLAGVDMTGYLSNLTEYYTAAYSNECRRIIFTSDIQFSEINSSKVVTCGLLLNEIITNSIKHAFDGIESPHIHISLIKDDENVVMSVKDNGVGFDSSKTADTGSLGMLLIKSLTEQLYGKLSINSTDGTTVTVTFPR